MTPTGRFEVNREICLSISGHHEETWQPAWGVRTALVAIRSFMDTDAKGQIGGIECGREARAKMAGESGEWRCGSCGKSNGEVMRERQDMVDEIGKRGDEEVPEELRLSYREDLGKKEGSGEDVGKSKAEVQVVPAPTTTSTAPPPAPTRTTQVQPIAQRPDSSLAIIDVLIYGIVAALLYMVLKRFA